MVNKKFWLGILVMALVFGMTITGCKDSSPVVPEIEKTLIVQNIPTEVYFYGASGGRIGLFPVGTTPEQALTSTGLVAGADLLSLDIILSGSGPFTLTIPLYEPVGLTRWTGSGTFDIYVVLGGVHYYKSRLPVSITSAITTIPWSQAEEIH